MKYYVVAELGIAHAGSLDTAKEMIVQVARCGADAAKLQYYDWQEIKDEFVNRDDILEKVKQAQLDLKQIRKLRDFMLNQGLDFVCTPFKTRKKLIELARLSPYAIKIRFKDGPSASPDNLGLTRPGIDSRAVKRLFVSCMVPPFDNPAVMWNPKIQWLYCLPFYPPKLEDFEPARSTAFNGISDHYPHTTTAILAAAMTKYDFYIVEKHVENPYTNRQPDHPVSITFQQLREMVTHLRAMEKLRPAEKLWFPDATKLRPRTVAKSLSKE